MGGLAAGGGRVQRVLAKESIVSTLGVLCPGGLAGLSLTVPAALSFLLFNLLCAPCLAALAALRQEMASPRHFWFAVAYQTALAWLTAFGVYQVGSAAFSGYNPFPGGGQGVPRKRGKQHQRPRQKGALVLFTERTRFRSGPGTGTGERGCPMRLFPSPRTGRPSPGLQPGLPGPWRQSTGRRFSGCGPR